MSAPISPPAPPGAPPLPSAKTAARTTRILIVDDSAVMRSLLRTVILTDDRLEVVAVAADGASALRAIDSFTPDLVLLDVEMPVMDGLQTLRQMRARGSRVPVIMCSALTQRGAQVTIEALASGALDYVAKPSGAASRDAAIQTLAQDLVPKILALTSRISPVFNTPPRAAQPASLLPNATPPGRPSSILPPPLLPNALPNQPPPPSLTSGRALNPASPSTPRSAPAVVLIGVSTGGPAALELLLPTLPATFPLPVLIVQHMPALFTRMLAQRLDGICALAVKEATDGQAIVPGQIAIAPGGWHLEVTGKHPSLQPRLRLNQNPPENHCRPAVDVLFRTAAAAYGSRTLGIILTGMGSDGLAGSRRIRELNGIILAQDAATSAIWGMPGAVAQAGLADKVLPINAIAPEILRLAARTQREAQREPALRESAV